MRGGTEKRSDDGREFGIVQIDWREGGGGFKEKGDGGKGRKGRGVEGRGGGGEWLEGEKEEFS